MRLSRPLLPVLVLLPLAAALPACAPQNTGTTVSAYGLGRPAQVSFGTIVGGRPVNVAGRQSGAGSIGGAVAGGIAGSFIGGDWRSNALAGIGGAIIGGLAGNAIEGQMTQGTAIEFFVRPDDGPDFAVTQTNEQGLQVGERVVITRGDRVQLSRAAGGPPPQAGLGMGGGISGGPISGK